MNRKASELLVIGGGPYGLSVAALARRHGIDTRIVGAPMSFWKDNMPSGMFLRSGIDWQLDGAGENTFVAYLETADRHHPAGEPIPIGLFLDYTAWFEEQEGLDVEGYCVHTLQRDRSGFVAIADDGARITARTVVACPGLSYFANVPAGHPVSALPSHLWRHTCNLIEFAGFAGARILIVGGRQSAFEWAALAREAGARHITVCHRHPTPPFVASDWSWVDPPMERTVTEPGWFWRLPAAERDAIAARFWAEGRMKMEPWLWPRLDHDNVDIRGETSVSACRVDADEAVHVEFDRGEPIDVDFVVLATGYKVDVTAVPYLRELIPALAIEAGSPVLGDRFEASLPGLFFAGQITTRQFGPFFGFVRGCPVTSRVIVAGIEAQLRAG